MRKIWQFLKQHVAADFHVAYYGFIAIFLAACVYYNYRVDFEDSFLDYQEGFTKFFYFFLSNIFAYIIPVLAYAFFSKNRAFLSSPEFWIKSLVALAFLSFDRCSFFIDELAHSVFQPRMYRWGSKIFNNLLGIITMMLPFFILYRVYDRAEKHLYGLAPKRFDVKPYFTMLLIMLPLIVAASFLPSFLNQYPMYESSRAHLQMQVPEWVTVAGYEIAYALNFISIEFFFRGFLVIGMISVLGRGAIVPMACVYCFLHFGKPMGEAISSIFGGYILGVVAYETRGIWGGVIVHVGIAWMMEFAAFVQKAFQDNT
jgi:hypothetical protein